MKKTAILLLPIILLCVVPAWASAMDFDDVPSDSWYSEAVKYVHENNVMNGFSQNEFRPDSILNRGQLAAILYRAEGSPQIEGNYSFSDVSSSSYYADAASCVNEKGIMLGYADGTFHGDEPVTHQQAITILWRCDGCPQSLNESNFEDANEVSNYAISAVNWAWSMDFLDCFQHNSEKHLYPTGGSSRAEIACVLYEWLKWHDVQEYFRQRNNLILYFSLDENDNQVGYLPDTETITIEGEVYDAPKLWAKMICDYIGGDVVSIRTTETYVPLDISSFSDEEEYENVTLSISEGKTSPQLSTMIDGFDNYEYIFMVYPLWYLMPLRLPEPFYTLFHTYNFMGKKVIPVSIGGNASVEYFSFRELGRKDITVFTAYGVNDGACRYTDYYAKDLLSGIVDKINQHNALVVFYAQNEQTRRIASIIATYMNADTFSISHQPWLSSERHTDDITSNQESSEYTSGSSQDISTGSFVVPDIDKYDIVYLGFTNWENDTREVIERFVEENSFNNKIVIPFYTSEFETESSDIISKELAAMAESGKWENCIVFLDIATADEITYILGQVNHSI